MIGDRIADALAEAAMDASGRAPVLLDGQQGDTYERLRDDLKAAVSEITATSPDEADAAAAALIDGDTGPAERLLDEQAAASRNSEATAAGAEALHLKAALQATHDPAGALDQRVHVPLGLAAEIGSVRPLIRNIANNLNQIAHNNNAVLRDIARDYLRQRAPHCLDYHFLVSADPLGEARPDRMTRQQF
jgi:hypothetical protein